jgi:Leucine-rich repeat (LRR) protein
MPRRLTPDLSLDDLKREAKRWLKALRANNPDAHARFDRALPGAPHPPTLRTIQLALAREFDLTGWTDLKQQLESLPAAAAGADKLDKYETMARTLLEAYETGTPEAMERLYHYTWHRRPWQTMRTYLQLELGKRPAKPGDHVPLTIDDTRYMIARGHGFADWAALASFVSTTPAGVTLTTMPVAVSAVGDRDAPRKRVRDWHLVLQLLASTPSASLEAEGAMTDDMLRDVARIETLTSLNLSSSHGITDEGLAHLARASNLRRLDLTNTSISDRGLAALSALPRLESLSLAMTNVTDAGMPVLARCPTLSTVNLMGTTTGDAAIRALAGHQNLRKFESGNGVTDEGLAMLHDLPVFKNWQGGEAEFALVSYDPSPNKLSLRGPFTDRGMQHFRGLNGLFALNVDASELQITAAALDPLATLPRLGWLAVDAKDDWMPFIAEMPRLQFLGAQDTSAGDDGFVALSRSRSIQYIWGRRCHNLRDRGFAALANMPALRGLSVSCLNVGDAAIAALPRFPALRELMPMGIPDAGYRHIGQCVDLESLILMYCRDTTDAATEHLTGLKKLARYFNSYTTITDRTPEILSTLDSLAEVTFDNCHNLTNAGIAKLAKLPKLVKLRVQARDVTSDVGAAFAARVTVDVNQ